MADLEADQSSAADPNAGQKAAWDGTEGAYWAEHHREFDRSVQQHHQHLMAALTIEPSDRVLDVGCGTGQVTRDVARAAAHGAAVGIDLSGRMVAVAADLAAEAGITNATFVQGDAQTHPFEPSSFDQVVSRTGAMFFGDLDAAFANVARALRPGAALTLLTWQPLERQEWLRAIIGALAAGRDLPGPPPDGGPFGLSRPERIHPVLEGAGFGQVECTPVGADMWFGADADAATAFVLGLQGWMLDGFDPAARVGAERALHTTMADHQTDDGVVFESNAWLISAVLSTP
jgi:SAM-dependent methyltransferase